MEIRKKLIGEVTLSTRVNMEVKAELEQLCAENGFKQAEFVRVAVMEALASFKAREIGKAEGKDE